MKKKFALILAFALTMALLTSCELMAPGPTERPSIGLPSAPAETGEPTPVDTSEPPVENYGFTVFPEGNYLADRKFDTDEYLPDYDADPSFIHAFSTTGNYVLCRTESTAYVCFGNLSRGTIKYLDKATGICLPLCGKPECLHDSSTCNAYVPGQIDGLRVYEGKLYWISGSTIMRMNLDGTDREIVGQTHRSKNGLGNPIVVIHRGYVYFAGAEETIIDGEAKTTVKIYADALDGSESFTLFDRLGDYQGSNCQLKPVGNDLYIVLSDSGLKDIYRWDSKNREVELVASLADNPQGLVFASWSFHPVPGDGVYLACSRQIGTEEDEPVYEHGVAKYSFETGAIEEILWLEHGSRSYFTKDYIILPGSVKIAEGEYKREMYVYDYSGTFLFSVDCGDNGTSVFMGADEMYIYGINTSINMSTLESKENFFAVPLDGGDVIVIG